MIFETQHKTACDVKNCRNTAEFYLPRKDYFAAGSIFAAVAPENWAEELAPRAPKSPKSVIKRKMEEKI